ncbi:MAG: B12-binding domain-containing radical SAM protein [Methanobacteriota archaeon]|nr:MAG: B12-binding domain-containing radical SAM protein [Euryarchaeota archaeon]
MSTYNGSQFIGFAACFPRVLPRWLYARLFCPAKSNGNAAIPAPAGLRKVEAVLVESGIPEEDVEIVHPMRIRKAVDSDTRVVGVTTSDPLGKGPASSTFSSLIRREPYTAYYFRELLTHEALRSDDLRVIVGGPGVWQLADPNVRASLGIDCIVEGEAELVAPRLFRDALEGAPLPGTVSGGTVPMEKVPVMRGPTINGTVEVSRGCGRGCEFCNPNMRRVRHVPLEKILDEIRLNIPHSPKVTLHAEDVLRYKADGIVPDKDEVLRLFSEATKLTDDIGISHIALSSALSRPDLEEELADLLKCLGTGAHIYAQTGIETGSSRLVSRHMKGKAKPFSPEDWPEVVRESMKLLSGNGWVACGTLVLGMPGEQTDDVLRTLELVRDLRRYKSLIVPLFFVPLGEMTESDFFTPEGMLPEHWMLLAECIDHDFHWSGILMDELFSQNRMSGAKSRLMKFAAWYMQRRLKPYMETMKEGVSPLEGVAGLEEPPHAFEIGRQKAKA